MPKFARRRRRYPMRRRRRRGQRGTSWYKWADWGWDKATKLSSLQSSVDFLKGIVNAERFHLDTSINATPGTTSAVVHLTALANGDGDGARTGNSVKGNHLMINLRFLQDPSGVADFFRVIIFRDKQQVADTSPAMTDVLEAATPTALINKANIGRFQILSDVTHKLSVNGNVAQQQKYVIRTPQHVRYNGTASSDIQKNGLYIAYVGTDNTNKTLILGSIRFAYYDN